MLLKIKKYYLFQSKKLWTVSCDNLDVDVSTGDIWLTCQAVRYCTIKYLEPDEHRPFSPSQVRTSLGNTVLLIVSTPNCGMYVSLRDDKHRFVGDSSLWGLEIRDNVRDKQFFSDEIFF